MSSTDGPRETRQRAFQFLVRDGSPRPFKGAHHNLSPEPCILLTDSLTARAPDRRARLARDDERLPRRRRRMTFGPDHLDLIAVLQLRQDRRNASVDLGADRRIADLGVDGVSKVDRRRAARKRNESALRREAKDLILKQLQARVLQKLLRTVAVREQFERFLQPSKGAAFLGELFSSRSADRILVERVGRDAEAGDFVHLGGSYLQFDPLMTGSDHRRVNGVIVVLLWRGDVILETARHVRPFGVNDAERPITILNFADNDAKAEDIRKLLKGDGFALHLAPHRIGSFLAACDGRLNASRRELLQQLLFNALDDAAILCA